MLNAAVTDLMLIVRNAMSNEAIAAAAKSHQLTVMRYVKSCSRAFIAHPVTGDATNNEMITSYTNSFDNSFTIPDAEAPYTLRTLIFFGTLLHGISRQFKQT